VRRLYVACWKKLFLWGLLEETVFNPTWECYDNSGQPLTVWQKWKT
jgi:hypothetical protein